MKRSLTLLGALLATTMLAPLPALAQQQGETPAVAPAGGEPAADAAAEQSDRVVVRGVYMPVPQRETAQVASFLDMEDLLRQGDSDAALALTRLSGLSIVSERFAFVRGLGERYSSALLNGSPLPSPEPLRRTVPLDLFPTEILDGIDVQKTFSPNLPGEFGGGLIQLRTLRMPDENFLSVSTGVGINTDTLWDGVIFVRGGDADWTGYDDGLRDIPGPITDVLTSMRRLNEFDSDTIEEAGESLANSPLSVIQESADLEPDFSAGVTGGRRFDIGNAEVGLIGTAGYDSGWRTEIRERQYQSGNTALLDLETMQSTYTADVFGLASGSVILDDHSVQGTVFYTHSGAKEAQIDQGFDFNAPVATGLVHYESSNWVERELLMLQATGEHLAGPLKLTWRGSAAESFRDAPYQRNLERYINAAGVPAYTNANRYSLRFSEVHDEIVSGGADLAYEFVFGDSSDVSVLSAGIDHVSTVRHYDFLALRFTGGGALPADVQIARPDFLFSPDNIDPARFVLQEIVTPNDSHSGRLDVTSGYVQADLNVIPFVRTTFGVRYEEGQQQVRTYDRFGNSGAGDVNIENDYWLPSVLATWNFAEDMQLRLGYSNTIARPQFRELAQSEFFDPETDRTYQGNRGLIDSEIANYDARLEYYLGRDAFVTGSGFYKEIENPIEEIIFSTESSSANRTTFINSPRATLWGGEFEFRKYFDSPIRMAWFEDRAWLAAFNYTYTKTEVEAEPGDMVFDGISGTLRDASFYAVDGSSLQGTPEHILNVQTGWQGTNDEFTVLVGWVDERILQRGTAGAAAAIPDVVEKPGVQLDLTYRRFFVLGGRDMTLTLSGRNLLGTDHIEYQESAALGRTDYNSYARGETLSVSLSSRF